MPFGVQRNAALGSVPGDTLPNATPSSLILFCMARNILGVSFAEHLFICDYAGPFVSNKHLLSAILMFINVYVLQRTNGVIVVYGSPRSTGDNDLIL